MKKFLFWLILMFLFMPCILAKNVTVNIFHSNSCPHCKSELEFLDNLDFVDVKKYEVSTYSKLYDKVVDKLNINTSSVPVTIIGTDYKIGYSDDIKEEILDMISSYQDKDYCDAVSLIIKNESLTSCLKKNKGIYKSSLDKSIKIFNKTIKFNVKDVSLPLISILIGFLDGFNPCAMWVLIFLISMLFNMKDKKKMWILGLTFLVVSALVYLVFMLGILTVANSIGNIFKYIIGVVAIVGGLINLKSFIKSLNKDTGCQVTNKNQRKKITNRIIKYINEKNFILSLLGISALAVSVNLIELACSAGLPTMFIEILSLNNLNSLEYILYMALYIIMFMLDDIIIFVIAMTTLKITGISNKYTKYSHLIGGIIMFIIGILMIFKTDWLMFNF
ncbi:MAG: hypothetical protein Q4E75_00315 [bacterium]|nr:hypothetical protein [bacterium]